MASKDELSLRLTALTDLKAKLQTMPLTAEEHELLEDLLSAQQDREQEEWLHGQAERAVDLLFPVQQGGRTVNDPHPKWHEKSWWWNGACIQAMVVQRNGDIEVELSSYVGGGETDALTLTLKHEWLAADDMAPLITTFMVETATRRDASRAAQELAQAQTDLAAAQARLARLADETRP